MRKILTCLAATVLLFAACKKDKSAPVNTAGEVKADWTSDNGNGDNYTGKSYPPYSVHNNVWGPGHGYQSIWANNGNNWGVYSDHPNTSGIKSYPFSDRYIKKALSSLNSLTSHFDVTVPSSGSWGADYDIWTSNDKYEVMLWINYRGNVGPKASSYPNGVPKIDISGKNIGGHTWNIYKSNVEGGKQVFSFLRTGGNLAKGDVNIKDIMNYLKNDLHWIENETVDRVEFGFEITSTAGGMNHTVNNYTVSFN